MPQLVYLDLYMRIYAALRLIRFQPWLKPELGLDWAGAVLGRG